MSIEKAREIMSRKITSRTELEAAMIEAGIVHDIAFRDEGHKYYTADETAHPAWYFHGKLRLAGVTGRIPLFPGYSPWGTLNDMWPYDAWPLLREGLRTWIGAYERPPEALESALGVHMVALYGVHMSKQEPGMAVYTPDAAAYAADKQVRLAPGRLLRKLMPQAPDSFIANVEAAIRAELSDELEIITDRDEIAKAYTSMVGDSGCMRHKPDYFGLPKNLHPSMVYSGPGLGVAVYRDAQQRVKARAVVYINPDNPEDRRYVRLYGDAILGRRLERKGFVMNDLNGARLAKLPVPDNRSKYVMPYIDRAGGRGSGRGDDGRYVVLDGDYFRCLTMADYDKITKALRRAGITEPLDYARCADSTNGSIYLEPIPAGVLTYTCGISGKEYSDLSTPSVLWLPEPEGTAVRVAKDNLPAGAEAKLTIIDSLWVDVYVPAGTPVFGDTNVDNAASRTHCGYVRFDSRFYPDEPPTWRRCYELGEEHVEGEQGMLRMADAVRLVSSTERGDEKRVIHKSELPAGAVKLWSRGSKTLDNYAAEGAKWVTTRLGRKVHTLTHEIAQMWDGSWDFANKVTQVYISPNTKVAVYDATEYPTPLQLPGRREVTERNVQRLIAVAREQGKDDAALAELMRTSVVASLGWGVRQNTLDGRWARYTMTPQAQLSEIRAAAQACLAAPDVPAAVNCTARYCIELIDLVQAALAPAPAAQPDRFAVAA